MQRRNLKDDTVQKAANTLGLLKLICGDIPVSRISSKHIRELLNLFRWAPLNIIKEADLLNRSAEEIIAEGQAAYREAPASATIELHRRLLNTFFTDLQNTGAIAYSPMKAIRKTKPDLMEEGRKKSKRHFKDADLAAIFERERFMEWASKYPHRYWAPIIGLYTGARVNEVCQLKVADVAQIEGTWCLQIRITPCANLLQGQGKTRQSLKGKSAIRDIPIAQQVLDAGFLDFVDDMKAFGHPRLFPHLTAGVNRRTGRSNARYSQAFLIQFGKYLKDLGYPKGVGFHAFRHTLATRLTKLGVRDDHLSLITGHTIVKRVPTLHENYIHDEPENEHGIKVDVISRYAPPVVLPVYKRGQFAERLGNGAKIYP